jgi:hypothetical protein
MGAQRRSASSSRSLTIRTPRSLIEASYSPMMQTLRRRLVAMKRTIAPAKKSESRTPAVRWRSHRYGVAAEPIHNDQANRLDVASGALALASIAGNAVKEELNANGRRAGMEAVLSELRRWYGPSGRTRTLASAGGG